MILYAQSFEDSEATTSESCLVMHCYFKKWKILTKSLKMAYLILGHRPGQKNQMDRNLGPKQYFLQPAPTFECRKFDFDYSFTKKYKIPPGDRTYFFQTDL